jgi:hypothetical protein
MSYKRIEESELDNRCMRAEETGLAKE